MWAPAPGQTLFITSGPKGDHLFVVILGPCPLGGYGQQPHVIMVGVTTVYPGTPFDDACVLEPGDHPFVTHRSFVTYRFAKIDPEQHVLQMVRQAMWRPGAPLTAQVLGRIRDGVCRSTRVARELKVFLGC